MSKNIILIFLICLIACSTPTNKPVTMSDLVFEDGIAYKVGEDLPFTGSIVENYESGYQKIRGKYYEGVRTGIWDYYYDSTLSALSLTYRNGQEKMMRKETVADIPLHGLEHYLKFHWNGVQKMEGLFKDGKEDGIWYTWDEEGNPEYKITYQNGKFIKNTPLSCNSNYRDMIPALQAAINHLFDYNFERSGVSKYTDNPFDVSRFGLLSKMKYNKNAKNPTRNDEWTWDEAESLIKYKCPNGLKKAWFYNKGIGLIGEEETGKW